MEINMHGNPLMIISACIPHGDSDNNSRDRVWENLSGFIGDIPEAIHVIVLGDLNTNLHTRKEGEENHMGPSIYGRGAYFLRDTEVLTPAEKTTNREHLIMLLRANGMKVANTYFHKGDNHTITYQKQNNTDGGPPWDTERYCELDHCPVEQQWSNSTIDKQSDPHTDINIDHKMVAIQLRQKLIVREEPNREPTLKGITPEKEGQSKEVALDNYSIKFRELVNDTWDNDEYNKDELCKLTKEAAQHSFDKPKTEGRKQNATLDLEHY